MRRGLSIIRGRCIGFSNSSARRLSQNESYVSGFSLWNSCTRTRGENNDSWDEVSNDGILHRRWMYLSSEVVYSGGWKMSYDEPEQRKGESDEDFFRRWKDHVNKMGDSKAAWLVDSIGKDVEIYSARAPS